MLSTSEAAQLLGITQRRVTALIESGDILATRIGRTWAVDEESVRARMASTPRSGRPRFGEREAEGIGHYTLMCRNDEVLEFTYDHRSKAVTGIKVTGSSELAPVGSCSGEGNPTQLELGAWIAARYIPKNRIGIQELLRKAGLADTSDLMFKAFGLNLTDQYWFKPVGTELDWDRINFFDNSYEGDADASGPGSGTPGMLPKWWEWREGESFLVKGSSHGEREPYAEVLATKLYERILDRGDFVSYTLEHIDGKPFSICENFVARNEQLVPLRDVFTCYGHPGSDPYDYRQYTSICERLGVPNAEQQLAKMLVCDFLTANIDRHDLNLGLIRNVDTMEFVRVAPIFDNGRCFYFDAQREHDLGNGAYFYTAHPFSEYPSVQLSLVNDFSWFDSAALEGFRTDIIDVLSQNDLLPEWFPAAAATQFGIQLERVVEAQRERRVVSA